MSKKKPITKQRIDEIASAWALTPFLMTELLKRAREGNRTAISIIKTAENQKKYMEFRQSMTRVLGGL